MATPARHGRPPPRPWRAVAGAARAGAAAAVAVLLWAAPAFGVAPFAVERGAPYLLWSADLALVDSPTPPGADAHWRPVELPDSWRRSERWRTSRDGWYRFTIAAAAPAEPTSVYLWRFSLNPAVR